MLPLLPLHNIRGPATILIRELVYSSVNKEDGGKPVHASGASALRPRFLPQAVPTRGARLYSAMLIARFPFEVPPQDRTMGLVPE